MSYLSDCLYILPNNYSILVKSPHLQRILQFRDFFLMQKPYFMLWQGNKKIKADKIMERASELLTKTIFNLQQTMFSYIIFATPF